MAPGPVPLVADVEAVAEAAVERAHVLTSAMTATQVLQPPGQVVRSPAPPLGLDPPGLRRGKATVSPDRIANQLRASAQGQKGSTQMPRGLRTELKQAPLLPERPEKAPERHADAVEEAADAGAGPVRVRDRGPAPHAPMKTSTRMWTTTHR